MAPVGFLTAHVAVIWKSVTQDFHQSGQKAHGLAELWIMHLIERRGL